MIRLMIEWFLENFGPWWGCMAGHPPLRSIIDMFAIWFMVLRKCPIRKSTDCCVSGLGMVTQSFWKQEYWSNKSRVGWGTGTSTELILVNFSQKLHEIKQKMTKGGHLAIYYVDPLLAMQYISWNKSRAPSSAVDFGNWLGAYPWPSVGLLAPV